MLNADPTEYSQTFYINLEHRLKLYKENIGQMPAFSSVTETFGSTPIRTLPNIKPYKSEY